MASLTRSSLSSSKASSSANVAATAAAAAAAASHKPFHGPKFFEVLGRIDEESSFRASSISNRTYNDFSQDYSTASSDEASTERWSMNLSPTERNSHGINSSVDKETNESKSTVPIHRKQSHQCYASMGTSLGNSRSDAAATAAEGRQDQSSELVSPALSATEHEQHRVIYSKQKVHRNHRDRDHHRDNQRKQLAQQHKDNEGLLRECEELESTIFELQSEGNIRQMRTLLRFRNYQAEIQRVTCEKQALEAECRNLEDQIRNLRKETEQKQKNIMQAEEQSEQRRFLRLREEQQCRRNNLDGGSNHEHKHQHQHQHKHKHKY